VHIVELSTAVAKVDIKVINASLTQNQCLQCITLPLTVSVRKGELCVRHVETLLISRRVNAGKFSYCTTLLSYLLPVKWRKHQYAKLINEFLANFLLHLPYRKCCLTLNAAAAEALLHITTTP